MVSFWNASTLISRSFLRKSGFKIFTIFVKNLRDVYSQYHYENSQTQYKIHSRFSAGIQVI